MKPDIEMNDDGGATVTFPAGYKGVCMNCMDGTPATQEKWMEFDEPIAAIPEFDIPAATGVWIHVCDKHQ